MSSRGTYRTIHSSLIDDPDFQRLSPHAQQVFFLLRVCKEHGASGIYRYYIETIARRANLTVKQVDKAMRELATVKTRREHGWIVFDDAIVWIVNGLRYDPHLSLANEKHKKTVEREISELPTREIVLKYCDYYKLEYPFATHSLQDSDSDSESDNDSDTDTNTSPREIPEELVAWGSRFCLIQKYNRETPDNLPSVKSLSKTRIARERYYLNQYPSEEWWSQTFKQYHASAFLSGRVAPSNGHGTFKPDFDWLLSKGKDGVENVVKVHDGRYR